MLQTSIRSPASRAGGRPWSARASRSTPTAISCCAPMSSAAAWARPGRARPTLPQAALLVSTSQSSPCATWSARKRDCWTISASPSCSACLAARWAASYKDRVFSAVPIACSARHSSQNIAFHEVGRQAVMADPDWCQGRYLEEGKSPRKGLAVARMAAHITYLSDAALHHKFGRNLQDRDKITFGFDADFQVESYLRHQGLSFVDRFDANSYL